MQLVLIIFKFWVAWRTNNEAKSYKWGFPQIWNKIWIHTEFYFGQIIFKSVWNFDWMWSLISDQLIDWCFSLVFFISSIVWGFIEFFILIRVHSFTFLHEQSWTRKVFLDFNSHYFIRIFLGLSSPKEIFLTYIIDQMNVC